MKSWQFHKACQKTKNIKSKKLRFEFLEERRLLTSYSVTSNQDVPSNDPNYGGTLRWAIESANENDGEDTIVIEQSADCFETSINKRIFLNHPLPAITEGVNIWTYSTDKYACIDAAYSSDDNDGLVVDIASGSQTVDIRRLNMINFSGDAFRLSGEGLHTGIYQRFHGEFSSQ